MPQEKNFANLIAAPTLLSTPQVQTDSFNSDALDITGYRGAEFMISYGIEGTGLASAHRITAKLQEADTSSGSYTDVAAADVLDSRTTASNQFGKADANADIPGAFTIGYNGAKNYVRVAVTFDATHTTGTIIAIHGFKILPQLTGASRTVEP